MAEENHTRSQYAYKNASNAMDKVRHIPIQATMTHPNVQAAINCLAQAVFQLIEENRELRSEIESLKEHNHDRPQFS